MLTVTLPDGNQKQFPGPVTVYDVAASIAPSLAKAAIAGEVDGRQVDLNYLLEQNANVKLITAKDKAGLEILRHSTAHLLAHAVKELYGNQVQVTIGPVIEDGFYYDFAFDRTFTPADLEQIEAKMREIAARNISVVRKTMGRDEAIQYFRGLGENYKAEIIESIPANETLSLYEEDNFVDLCRGPRVPNTKWLKVFKLMKVAGAYWRGDSKNAMLQRIYGTAWFEKADLDAYLHRLEEAEKRDHRKIGKALDLFHTQEDSPGMVFWHPNGWVIYQVIEQYIRNLIRNNGYQEIRTPLILSAQLWQKSGHWDNFRDDMFVTQAEERELAVKPMNCPGAIQVYNQGLKSYRELPLRLAEFGSCQRNEASGALHGLMRVRSFVQDDAHIFCTEDQIQTEVAEFIDLLYRAYRDFGFEDVLVKLSTRPAKRVGSDEIWDKAEHALERALNAKGLAWELSPGEGAFYGPKLEFSLRDCLGRIWQCGTMQVDFSMPQRLGAEYVAEDNTRQVPVMLHRAIVGSLERFIGILIEHHAGLLPAWLSPTQVVVMNITDKQADYAKQVTEKLELASFRAKYDLRNEKIGFKIREQTLQRVPYLLVVGDREMTEQTVAVRTRSGKDLGSMPLAEFIEKLNRDVAQLGRIALEE